MEVLLVDDSPSDAKLTARWLGASPICQAVHFARDGEQALQFLRRAAAGTEAVRALLVLLDLNLPGMSGLEVLTEIRADSSLAEIPVVVCSSSRFPEDEQRARELGACLYLAKPGDADEFTAMVQVVESFWKGLAASAIPRPG